MLAALVLTINPVLQYSVYEALRYRVLHRQVHKDGKNRSEIGSATVFTIAAASKCIATLLTYPLVRAKVLQQVGRVRGNLGKVLLIVLSREGLEGWYRGLKEQMLKTVLQAAIMLSIKEKLDQLQRGLVRTWMRRRNVKQIRLD